MLLGTTPAKPALAGAFFQNLCVRRCRTTQRIGAGREQAEEPVRLRRRVHNCMLSGSLRHRSGDSGWPACVARRHRILVRDGWSRPLAVSRLLSSRACEASRSRSRFSRGDILLADRLHERVESTSEPMSVPRTSGSVPRPLSHEPTSGSRGRLVRARPPRTASKPADGSAGFGLMAHMPPGSKSQAKREPPSRQAPTRDANRRGEDK